MLCKESAPRCQCQCLASSMALRVGKHMIHAGPTASARRFIVSEFRLDCGKNSPALKNTILSHCRGDRSSLSTTRCCRLGFSLFCFFFALGKTRCQFNLPREAVPVGGGLSRCLTARPSVRSIREPRMVGRSGASRVGTSTRLRFARRTPSLSTASGVRHRSFRVRLIPGRGTVRGRLIPNHGRGSSTIDTQRGR